MATNEAEMFIIGQLKGGRDFSSDSLCCKYSLAIGEGWSLANGDMEGQTQVDTGLPGELCTWSSPIDIHLTTTTPRHWPRLVLEVWSRDVHGRSAVGGYGAVNLPFHAGTHSMTVHCWRPVGTFVERLTETFVGGGVALKNPQLVLNAANREDMHTRPAGAVELELTLLMNGFDTVDGTAT